MLPFRVLLHRRRHPWVALTGDCLPCGFLPLRRLPGTGQPLTLEGTSLQVRALSAFRTPSGPFSARDLPALFHAGPALGVHPSGSISTRRAVHPLGCRALSRLAAQPVFRPGHLGSSRFLGNPGSASTAFRGDGPPFELPLLRALLPASVRVHEANCLSWPRDRDPHGFSSSRGSPVSSATRPGSILS